VLTLRSFSILRNGDTDHSKHSYGRQPIGHRSGQFQRPLLSLFVVVDEPAADIVALSLPQYVCPNNCSHFTFREGMCALGNLNNRVTTSAHPPLIPPFVATTINQRHHHDQTHRNPKDDVKPCLFRHPFFSDIATGRSTQSRVRSLVQARAACPASQCQRLQPKASRPS